MAVKYTISTVASKTGLTTHTIRAWERRYAALAPARTETNRRLYNEADVERLLILKSLLDSGHSIGQVAGLPLEELRSLSGHQAPGAPVEYKVEPEHGESDPLLSSSLVALERHQGEELREALNKATSLYGAWGLLDRVVLPLVQQIEERWEDGRISIAQEHLGSAVIRAHLDELRTSIVAPVSSPKILVTTPQNQIHEIGALIVSIVAAMQSWNVLYVGANLPANEIVSAVHRSGANALGLSIVYPLDDTTLNHELRVIRRGLGSSVPIFVGGRGVDSYRTALEEIGALIEPNIKNFRERLDRTREEIVDSL